MGVLSPKARFQIKEGVTQAPAFLRRENYCIMELTKFEIVLSRFEGFEAFQL